MKVRLLLIAIVAFLFLQSNITFAQAGLEAETSPLVPGSTTSKIYLGPVAGYNRSLHSVDLSSFVDDPLCPFFTNGSGNGYFFGVFYEQFIGGLTGSKHSIVARLLYNVLPASFTKEGDTYPSLVQDPNDTSKYVTVNSSTRHSVEVTYNMISLDLMYKFNVIGGVVLTVGPTFDIPMTKNLKQKYEIVEPNYVQFKVDPDAVAKGYQYLDNNRTIVVYDGDISRNPPEKSAGFRFGLKGGLQYEIITGSIFDVIPGVFYNLGLTNATDVLSWKVNALQIGVDLRFAL
jgi:hypothetical protein